MQIPHIVVREDYPLDFSDRKGYFFPFPPPPPPPSRSFHERKNENLFPLLSWLYNGILDESFIEKYFIPFHIVSYSFE